ncbi:MAG TPA: phosphatase PAP2 family protein [Candidatus Krumholzibacteria bacterium]|nr:phosphatase PAP2 family protein [Candidatus Krumholzibacteria bacterium]
MITPFSALSRLTQSLALLFAAIAFAAPVGAQTLSAPNLESGGGPAAAGIRGELSRFASDLATQGSYPFRLAWNQPGRAVVGVGVLAGLVALDPAMHDATHADPESPLASWGRTMSVYGNGLYVLPAVAGFGLIGALGSSREADTAILLAESSVSAGLWTLAVKELSGRERPRETHEGDGDWTGPRGVFAEDPTAGHSLASFPSGHSSGAWAAATVLAHQYPYHHIVPLLAFGGAAAMSYARMVVDAHWFSDVVVGGLIGVGCARQIIGSRERSRSSLDSASWVPMSLFFDMGPNGREIGLSCRF